MTHAGCSLKLILDWAWDRVVDIKDQLDQLCKNSFVDHRNSLLVDSFKKLKKELTALLPKVFTFIGNVTNGSWKYWMWIESKFVNIKQSCNLEEPLFEL